MAQFVRLLGLLLAVFLICGSASDLSAQNVDTTRAHVDALLRKANYYINQSRKSNVPEAEREKYKLETEKIHEELDKIKNARFEFALFHPEYKNLLSTIKKDSLDIASDLDMAKVFDPELYPVEPGAIAAGVEVSYLPVKNFSAPAGIFADKTITSNITAGLQLNHFTQQDEYVKGFPDPKDFSYTTRSKNYTYSNVLIGLRASYHLFKPGELVFGMDPRKWDFYGRILLGYSLALKPDPFLENRSFERDPSRDGIAYGVFGGVRYMTDDRLGFHGELGYGTTGIVTVGFSYKFVKSEVVKEKPKKGKGKSSSSKKGKGKSSSKKKKR